MSLYIVPELEQEYQRWLDKAGPEQYFGLYVTGIHTVLRAHFLIVDHFWKQREGVGGIGPKSLDLLHSAVSRQLVGFNGIRKWNDSFDICATLFYGLVKNHAFHDCNKRTALLTALYQLNQQGRTPTAFQRDLERLTIRTAENALSEYEDFSRFARQEDAEVKFISHYLRRNTRLVDKKTYIITFQQLNSLLKKHGAYLGNPDGNYVHVMKQTKRRRGLFFAKEEIVEERVMKIGFPGMKSQVNPNTVKDIRRKLGLVAERGCDSAAFFRDADTMQSLIATYNDLLQRLANK